MKRAICAACIGWAVATGCGGVSEPPEPPETALPETAMDMIAARASIDQVLHIVAAMSAMTGGDAASDVTSLMAAHQDLVTPPPAEGSPGGEVTPFSKLLPPPPPASGSAVCTAASCAFTTYGYTLGYDVFRIDGTVTHSGDLLVLHVSYEWSFKVQVDRMVWTLDGSISTVAGLDGSANFHATGSGISDGVRWGTTIKYRAITLDAQGCPTGGSLQASTSYAPGASLGGGPPGFALQASTAFGPGCR